MSEKLLLKDVAEKLGLSTTTISFILNGKGPEMKISQSAIDRVFKFVHERGFKTNHLAKSLATGKTMTIGLLVEKISDSFFAELAYYIEKSAYEYGYKVIYCSTDNDNNTARGIINLFRERHVDAYIIVPTPSIKKEIQSLIDDNIPVVLFDRYYSGLDCDYVGLDNFESSYNAINHLIHDCGRTNIGFITTSSKQTQMLGRLEGYQKAIAESQLTPLVKRIEFSHQNEFLEKEIRTFLRRNPQIDGLLFATHYLAMAAIRLLREKKPEEISFISYDDQPFYNAISPTVTGIAQPIEKMSISLVNILIDKMAGGKGCPEPKKIVFPAALHIRESSRCLLPVSAQELNVSQQKLEEIEYQNKA